MKTAMPSQNAATRLLTISLSLAKATRGSPGPIQYDTEDRGGPSEGTGFSGTAGGITTVNRISGTRERVILRRTGRNHR
jgi:hypothetical protein